jgi:hypothetical protein
MKNERFPGGCAPSPGPPCSPTKQSIASLARQGSRKKGRPRPTAAKLPVGLEGKTDDQIARSSIASARVRRGGSPSMTDHGVRVGCPANSTRERQSTWLRVGLTSTTAMGHGKHRAIGVQDLRIPSIASRRRG